MRKKQDIGKSRKICYAIVILTISIVALLSACGKEKISGNKIPDVFGVNYADAIEILEADGYEVKATEMSVGNISEKLLYPLEKVDKGSIFKIDDYILDGNGNLNKDYDVYYDGELISEDKSVVIYYAKEDYILEKNDAPNTSISSTNSTTQTSEPDTTEKDNNVLSSDFKSAMDSYEKFMDEYVAFMKKYNANPTDIGLLADYTNYLTKYAEFVEDFEAWETEDMSTAEAAYYIEVQSRVTKKLLEVVQ